MFAEGTSSPEQNLTISRSSPEKPGELKSFPQIHNVKSPLPVIEIIKSREPKISPLSDDSRLISALIDIKLNSLPIFSNSNPEPTAISIDRLSETFSTNIDLFEKALGNPHSYSRTLEAVNDIFIYANKLFGTANLPEAERKKLVDLSNSVLSFMAHNVDKVELGIQNANLDGKLNGLNAVYHCLEQSSYVPWNEKHKAFASFLLSHFEPVLRQAQMENGLGDIGKSDESNTFLLVLKELSRSAAVQLADKEALTNMVKKLLKDENTDIRNFMGKIIEAGIAAYRLPYFDIYLKDVLEDYGLNTQNMMNEWSRSESESPHFAKATNFRCIFELESQRPGIASTLNKEFGISCFGRYPKDLLIAQYDERDKREDTTPYGVIINVKEDHNGAFYGNIDIYNKIFAQLQNRQKIKVFEVNNSLGIVHALNQARHDYGKISFAIIGGHGSEKDIQLGADYLSKKSSLRTEDLKRKGASALTLAFVENPTIILNSCSTGTLGGIGEEMSRLGATIVAPPTPVSIKDIDASIDDQGRPYFEVTYLSDEKAVPPNVYQKGVVKSQI